jgi:ribonucleotide monophosphatase NagD (HAD superfamily)
MDMLFKEVTGGHELQRTVFGKPETSSYIFVEKELDKMAQAQGVEIEKIFAIGDNPKSDVQGANNRGERWVSVLVRTGYWTGIDNDHEFPAKIVADNVGIALNKIREYMKTY